MKYTLYSLLQWFKLNSSTWSTSRVLSVEQTCLDCVQKDKQFAVPFVPAEEPSALVLARRGRRTPRPSCCPRKALWVSSKSWSLCLVLGFSYSLFIRSSPGSGTAIGPSWSGKVPGAFPGCMCSLWELVPPLFLVRPSAQCCLPLAGLQLLPCDSEFLFVLCFGSCICLFEQIMFFHYKNKYFLCPHAEELSWTLCNTTYKS